MFGSSEADSSADDDYATKQIGIKLAQIRDGRHLLEVEPDLASGVRFTVAGLTPNAARLSIRFYFANDFGVLTKHYQTFVEDTRIDPLPRDDYRHSGGICGR